MKKLIFPFLLLGSSCAFAVSLSARYDPAKDLVQLNWVKADHSIREFALEKSNDLLNWVVIAFQKVTDYSNSQSFQFIDMKPVKGYNYYRLKVTYATGRVSLSPGVSVNAVPYVYNWSVYPVPVGDQFTMQYTGTAPLKGVLNVLVQNMNGFILTRLRFASTSKLIQVSANNLFRGVYTLSVIIEDEVVWTRQIVK